MCESKSWSVILQSRPGRGWSGMEGVNGKKKVTSVIPSTIKIVSINQPIISSSNNKVCLEAEVNDWVIAYLCWIGINYLGIPLSLSDGMYS